MEVIALVVCLCMMLVSVASQQFQCYSCSYTRSADPSLSYECVNDPQSVKTGMTTMNCQAPYMCVTKTLYNQEMTHIRSVTRGCQPQQEICKGESCCNESGVYPSCEHKCRSDTCNDLNPERFLKKPGDGGNGAAQPQSFMFGNIFIVALISLIL